MKRSEAAAATPQRPTSHEGQASGSAARPAGASWVGSVTSARAGLFDNFPELARVDGLERLGASLQLFEGFEHRLRHHLVRFLRAADEREFLPGRDALVSILVVKADPEDATDPGALGGTRALWLFAHAVTVGGIAGVSSGFSAAGSAAVMGSGTVGCSVTDSKRMSAKASS